MSLTRKVRIATTSFDSSINKDLDVSDYYEAHEDRRPTYEERKNKQFDMIEELIDKVLISCHPDIAIFSEFLFDRGVKTGKESRAKKTGDPIVDEFYLLGEFKDMLKGKCVEHNCCIIFNGMEDAGEEQRTNTSTFYDRAGAVVYKYHKMRIPLSESKQQNIIPGSEYCAFDTEFGKVAMMICFDAAFPEVMYELMKEKPEIIFLSTIGEYSIEMAEEAKLNNVYAVVSGSGKARVNGYESSVIINPKGEVLCGVTDRGSYRDSFVFNAKGDGAFCYVDIDLDM